MNINSKLTFFGAGAAGTALTLFVGVNWFGLDLGSDAKNKDSETKIDTVGYNLRCKDPQDILNIPVFRGIKFVEVVCKNSVDYFKNRNWSAFERPHRDGDISYWFKIDIIDLVSDRSEPFFCKSRRINRRAAISVELIPLASKHIPTPEASETVKLSDQIYLFTWSLDGYETSYDRYWDYYPIYSSLSYLYDTAEEPIKRTIESNVTELYKASMDYRRRDLFKLASLKCIEHPEDA